MFSATSSSKILPQGKSFSGEFVSLQGSSSAAASKKKACASPAITRWGRAQLSFVSLGKKETTAAVQVSWRHVSSSVPFSNCNASWQRGAAGAVQRGDHSLLCSRERALGAASGLRIGSPAFQQREVHRRLKPSDVADRCRRRHVSPVAKFVAWPQDLRSQSQLAELAPLFEVDSAVAEVSQGQLLKKETALGAPRTAVGRGTAGASQLSLNGGTGSREGGGGELSESSRSPWGGVVLRGLGLEAEDGGRSLAGRAIIKVVGVGGAGCNAVDHMIKAGLSGVEFWAVNTDVQALSRSLSPNKLQIGKEVTRGLGAGGDAAQGELAAEESLAELSFVVEGADLVFVAAGMGGGTGSGAAPVVARLAKALGALTVGVVAQPFNFEGPRRRAAAARGAVRMRSAADTLVAVDNERLLGLGAGGVAQLPVGDAFTLADDVLLQGVQGISDIITTPGLVNVDFADVRAVMSNAGNALLGVGEAEGSSRAEEAACRAILSPLLHTARRPTGVVYNITGGRDLTLFEVNAAARVIQDLADPNANVIFGAVIDDRLEGRVRMTVIATGFEELAAPANNVPWRASRSDWEGDTGYSSSSAWGGWAAQE